MGKNYKIFISLICILTLISMLVGCGGDNGNGDVGSVDDGEVYELSWAGIGATSDDAIDTWIANEAAKNIERETNGKVKITVYPASQLGDYVQAYEEIMQGTIDMGLFTMTGTYDIFAESLYVPFLIKDTDDFKVLYGQDSYIYEEYSKFQSEYGIKTFGFWPSGILGIGFSKLDDQSKASLFDFNVKKKALVRAPAMETMALIIKDGMNFNTTTINYADLYTALQTGVADGWYGGGPYLNYVSFIDVIDYFVDYKILPDVYACIMNEAKWDSIPAEYQAIINDNVIKAIEEGTDKLEVLEDECIQGLRDAGVEVIIPTDEERNAMGEFMRENIWPKLANYYGDEYMNKLAEIAENM